jgi:hypothetical protein
MKRFIFFGLSALLISGATPAFIEVASAKSTNEVLISKQNQTVLKSGNFRNGEHPTSGGAKIVEINGKRYIEFDKNFKTDAGPDLFVILHRSADVIGTTKAPAHSIKEGDYLLLEPLRTTSGSQRYEIPAEINLANYNSVAIWCRRFNATFGAASFNS